MKELPSTCNTQISDFYQKAAGGWYLAVVVRVVRVQSGLTVIPDPYNMCHLSCSLFMLGEGLLLKKLGTHIYMF
jgi:hypothetical protein